jgi:dTDP-4-dehydrorhamnose 3,5-epimerase-like enzyme
MKNINLVDVPSFGDHRGTLCAFEAGQDIPFIIKRCYCIYHTEKGVSRGYHAHKALKQMVICVSGSCRFLVDDGDTKENFILDSPNKGLLIEGLIWREMHDFSQDCVLIIFANEHFNESDYIRDYALFKSLSQKK